MSGEALTVAFAARGRASCDVSAWRCYVRRRATSRAGLEIARPQCVQKRVARRARSSAAEADMDEFRAGIHNDRGFGNNFRSEQGP